MGNEPWDAEETYDREIAPLMTRIIAICKQHQIPMLAVFQYQDTDEDGAAFCSTTLPFADRTDPELSRLMATPPVRPRQPLALAQTHVTNPDGSKTISIRRV